MAEEQKRNIPLNDLDFNLMTTESTWGKDGLVISQDLRKKLTKHMGSFDKDGNLLKNEDGTPAVTKESLWGLLGFYTRDMRLAFLNNLELLYCQYFLDLANDLLQFNMTKPFLISLSRVATILELSQSKGGFLRRRMHTFTSEHYQHGDEPQKRTLFGVGNSKGK